MLDSTHLLAAFASVLEQISETEFARLHLAIFNTESSAPAEPPRRGLASRVARILFNKKRREGLAWALYNRLDQRFFGAKFDPVAPVDCEPLLAGVERIDVRPERKGFVHRFPKEAIDQIRSKELDVILRFGFNILRGDVLTVAKYGIWSFHHGDNDYYRGGPAHFWELYEQNPLSGAILQVLTEKLDDGKVLAKSIFATERGISLRRNRVQPYWGTTHLVAQKLWELHRFGWEYVERRVLPPAPYLGRKKIYTMPKNLELAGWLGPVLLKKAAAKAGRTISGRDDVDHWRIAIRSGGKGILTPDESSRMADFRWVESPKGHFYADPFVLENDGKHWLFVEDFDYHQSRGVVACAEVSSSGAIGPVRTCLDVGGHASYPCVFRHDNNIYMIPETLDDEVVRLYRAVEFPYEWKEEAVLFRGQAVDTTPFHWRGFYWFFTSVRDPRGGGMAQYLFYSEDLTAPWRMHPSNPISSDVRSSRSAGHIIVDGEKLYRPSQDCSIRYGRAFRLNEIVTLTPDDYQEVPKFTVEPTWDNGLRATHTYNRAGIIEVTDGTIQRPRSRVM